MKWYHEGEAWKGGRGDGGGQGAPRFGRKARAWFRLRIEHLIESASPELAKHHAGAVDSVAEWFTARAEDYVLWVPVNAYRGGGYNAGEWQLNPQAIAAAVPTATRCVLAALRGPILPEPDVDAGLRELASAPEEVTKEQGAFHLLFREKDCPERAVYERWQRMRNRMLRVLPIRCDVCAEWHPPKRPGMVRCAGCVAAGTKRCLHCHETFAAADARQRRCDPCLAAAEKAAQLIERQRGGAA